MLILNHMYGEYGLVWTQLIADILTAIVSYAVYFVMSNEIASKKENYN